MSAAANAFTPTLPHHGEAEAADVNDKNTDDTSDKASDVPHKGTDLVAEKSRGVVEMESLQGRLNPKLLDQYTASYFLNYAVSYSFEAHSLQATIGTITSVFQAMSQPPIAKLSDVFGRVNTYIGCVVFYVVGYIIVASSNSIETYAVGNSIYILGITGLAPLTPDLWTIFPNIPGAINAFVAGNIVSSLLTHGDQTKQWRWGFAIFIILTPVMALPIIITLWRNMRLDRVARQELKAVNKVSAWTRAKAIFWQLDLIGLFLFTVGFGLFFVTITLANSRTARWSDAHSIAQLVVGAVVIIAFVLWERFYAPHPLLPFGLLRHRTVVGAVLIALFHPMAGRIVGGYLTTFLQVAANQSVLSTSRITSFPTVAGTVTTVIGAFVARRFRVLKPIIIFGFCLEILAIGLMIRYRTSTNSQGELAVVQLLRGAANGFIPFPTQAMVQAAAPHEHLAAITAGWLVVYYLSGGIGSAIGGALWTNIVPKKLESYIGDDALVKLAYTNPFKYATTYLPGTPERAAIARAQDEAQRIIVIVGLCVAVLALLSSIFLLDNYKLPDTQSLEEEERETKKPWYKF
ncbi:hypothetical protein IAU60_004908 [Kwoniella sp. DSM 27419]